MEKIIILVHQNMKRKVSNSYYYSDTYFPSTGKNKLLVVPVDFTDYKAESKLGEKMFRKKRYMIAFLAIAKILDGSR